MLIFFQIRRKSHRGVFFMKNSIKFKVGFIAIAVIIAFSFTACPEEGGDTIPAALIAKWYESELLAEGSKLPGAEIVPNKFEIKTGGKAEFFLNPIVYDVTISGSKITLKASLLTAGTATFKISGNKLTISGASPVTSPLTNGEYFKPSK